MRRRFKERGIEYGTITNTDIGIKGKTNGGYSTVINRIRNIVRSPASDSSPERDESYINNFRFQSPSGGDGDDDDGDEGPGPRRQEEDDRGKRIAASN